MILDRPQTPFELVLAAEVLHRIDDAMGGLDAREEAVLRARFAFGTDEVEARRAIGKGLPRLPATAVYLEGVLGKTAIGFLERRAIHNLRRKLGIPTRSP